MDKSQVFQQFQKDVGRHFTERELTHIWNEIIHSSYLPFDKEWNENLYKDLIKRLLNQEPYQYILGQAYFYDFELYVSPATLIPRSETEELVELVLRDWGGSSPKYGEQVLKVLDIGTGSGCIAIALARKLRNAVIEAIDVSEEALEIARKNANKLDVEVQFFQKNVLQIGGFRKTYDVIISNPPYIPHMEKSLMKNNVLSHEPHLALFVDDDDPLIFYKKIALLAEKALSPQGILYFECNEFNAKELQIILCNMNFSLVKLHQDLQGKDRMISVKK